MNSPVPWKEEAQDSKQGKQLARVEKRPNGARRETQTSRPPVQGSPPEMPLLRGPLAPEPLRFSLQARASPAECSRAQVRPYVLLADNTLESPWGFNFHPHSNLRNAQVHALFPKCGGLLFTVINTQNLRVTVLG